MANSDSDNSAVTHDRESYADDAKARRILGVSATGTAVDFATSAKQLGDGHNVTANAGVDLDTSNLALDSTLTDKSQVTKITDGVNFMPTMDAQARAGYVNVADSVLPNGAATSAKQLVDNHNVTANAGTNLNTSALALDSTLTDKTQYTQLTDGTHDVELHEGMIGVVNSGHLISEEFITGHKAWLKIGYNPEITNAEETVWSAGGTYVFPTVEAGLEVYSADAQDTGSSIRSGVATGGTTTTLVDSAANFLGGTAVSIGDCVLLDKSGSIPEWGKVTTVLASALVCSGGFSSGGIGDARGYNVLNSAASTGVQAVFIKYLDDNFVSHDEIVITNGGVVATVNTDYYRVNSFRVACAGTNNKAEGDIELRNLADTPVYAHMTAGFTIARQAVFTVPEDKMLYINSFNAAWCSPNDSKVQSARVILRANAEPRNGFNMGPIFFPYAEVMVTNEDVNITNEVPLKIPPTTDVIISLLSTDAAGTGPATVVMSGWTVIFREA